MRIELHLKELPPTNDKEKTQRFVFIHTDTETSIYMNDVMLFYKKLEDEK